jgi:ribonuclease HII
MQTVPTLNIENELKSKGYIHIIGVDEAGRGPLAGPVVAAAVHLPEGFDTEGINDSKKLSSKKRELFYNKIIGACTYSIHAVSNEIIDEINIREATRMAMRMCVNDMISDHNADFALVDGNFVPDFIFVPAQPVIAGDALSLSIAAASILAKVWRDRELDAMHTIYPVYNWKKNRGYGTQEHRDAIKLYGQCSYHRKSFRIK